MCARDWFLYIDVCAVAQKALPDLRCSEVSQAAVPAGLKSKGELHISRDTKADPPTCEAKPQPEAQRLCPCVPEAQARAADASVVGDAAVGDVVKKVLQDLQAAEMIEITRATNTHSRHEAVG